MYLGIKTVIRKEIEEQYGTMKNFIEKNPHLNLSRSKLSKVLNPSLNCYLSTINDVADALNMEVTAKRIPKVNMFVKTG